MWQCIYECLFPICFFQGIEKMKYIAIFSFIGRVVFILLIFIWVTTPQDYLLVPLINGIGAIITSLIAIYILIYKFKIKFRWQSLATIFYHTKDSTKLLLTSITGIVKDRTNTIVIGSVLGMGEVAYYDFVEKIVNVLSTIFYTISNVVFPYYNKNANKIFARKLLIYTTETALEIIYSYHLIHKDNPWIAGFSCNSLDLHGNLIGTSLPVDELVVSHYNLYNSLSVKGDKGLIYYTRILKEYPFPEFENEFFVTEALVLNRISLRYKICCIKRSLEIKDYQRDGLSSKYRHLCLRNPNGYALYINERNYFNLSFTNYVINAASYVRYSLFAGKSFRNIYKEAINRRWTFIIACFLGILLYIKDKSRS